jgi:hypothetical protein
LPRSGLIGGGNQATEIRSIVLMLPGIDLHVAVDVLHEATVVKVAVGVLEIPLEKRLPPALGQNVKTQVAPIEQDRGVIGTRHRDARGVEQFAADNLADARRILPRVVQRNLAEPVELLALGVLVEIQRQCRALIKMLETARGPFEVHGDIGVDGASFTHRGRHFRALVAPAVPAIPPITA